MFGERFWRWYDRGARLDFGGTLLDYIFDWKKLVATSVGGSGGVVTWIVAKLAKYSWLEIWVSSVVVAAALIVLVYFLIVILEKIRVSRARPEFGNSKLTYPQADSITNKPTPDIDAREAYFQILELSEWRNEQDKITTDTTHLVYDWREVRLNGEIHKALRNSRLGAWGEECLPGTVTTPEKPIPPDTWDKVEIVFDRTAFPRTAAHFKGYTSRQLGPMAWVGVKFSRQQTFQLFPLASSNDYRPILAAINHISQRTGDVDAARFWPATRLALRQAAYDKRVRMRGRKQLPENNPHTGNEYSELFTDVDSSYWATSEINVLATSTDNQSMYHTDPQTASAWGKQGIYERNRYAELKINWADLLKEWP
jgi:hypothetical protein